MPPLLADAEWMRWVGLIVFIVIYILNHFLGGDKKKAKVPRAKGAEAIQPDRTVKPAPPNRQTAPGSARQSQTQEIEAFLQRAKERRREKTPPQKTVAKAPPAPVRRLAETPLEAEVVKSRPLGASIANQQLDTRDVTEHSEHLTDDLTQADQNRELHRRKMFSHRVGRLEDTSGEVGAKAGEDAPQSNAAATAAAAVPISAAFFQPKDIRQAIIVSEVLQRPEHRW